MLVSLRNVKHKAGFFGLQIIFIFSKPLSYGLRPQGLVNLFLYYHKSKVICQYLFGVDDIICVFTYFSYKSSACSIGMIIVSPFSCIGMNCSFRGISPIFM